MNQSFRQIQVEYSDGIAIATLLHNVIQKDEIVKTTADELFSLVGPMQRIVVNFTGVEYLGEWFQGKLIGLHKKLVAEEGCLVLCNLHEDIAESLLIKKLDRLLVIASTLSEAMDRVNAT
jgi:anti-anti-sigma regulatory factor